MPKTIIIRKTWYCNVCRIGNGAGATNNQCGWDTDPGTTCPHLGCTGTVTLETDPTCCGTLTIIGVEDIDTEMQERDEPTYRQRSLVELEESITRLKLPLVIGLLETEASVQEREKAQREVATLAAETRFRARHQAKLDAAIATFSLAGYFLTTEAERTDYRTKRTADMTQAIVEATKRHYLAGIRY